MNHFFVVDNDSNDGSRELLTDAPDVSLWTTEASYRNARFGVDWLAWLKFKFGHGHWCLTVDADELFVFPDSEARSIHELTSHLEEEGHQSIGALMIDLFPKGKIGHKPSKPTKNPLSKLRWFDPAGYWVQTHKTYRNQWIQGGPRARCFFKDYSNLAPTLNKIPLVKWNRRYAYINSTHQILPVRLHEKFDPRDTSMVSGALLHTKFLPQIVEKSEEELLRRQHFANSDLYEEYYKALINGASLWHQKSVKYTNSADLIKCGLMSRGRWLAD